MEAYIPNDTWYDYYTGQKVSVRGQWTTLDAPLDKINVHLRGNSIIITQPLNGAVTTVKG